MVDEYGVQRGLRDKNGNSVVAGLTNSSRIESFKMEDGKKIPCEGKLWYRGYDCIELVNGFRGDHFGFEEVAYLLLFGKLPNRDELKHFNDILASSRTLPTNFTRDVIMKAPSSDIMNSLTRSVLTLASSHALPDHSPHCPQSICWNMPACAERQIDWNPRCSMSMACRGGCVIRTVTA